MPPPSTSSGTISISPLPISNTFSGHFDGYAVELKFLRNRYLVPGTTKLDFSALYAEIIRRRSRNQRTFGFNIGTDGELIGPEIAEPMGDEPLEPLLITGSVKDIVKFELKSWTFNPKLGAGAGYESRIELGGDGCGYASSKSAKGYIKLRKVWESEDGKALYEGFWEVKVVYDSGLGRKRRKGHGNGTDYCGSFWAVEKPSENN